MAGQTKILSVPKCLVKTPDDPCPCSKRPFIPATSPATLIPAQAIHFLRKLSALSYHNHCPVLDGANLYRTISRVQRTVNSSKTTAIALPKIGSEGAVTMKADYAPLRSWMRTNDRFTHSRSSLRAPAVAQESRIRRCCCAYTRPRKRGYNPHLHGCLWCVVEAVAVSPS